MFTPLGERATDIKPEFAEDDGKSHENMLTPKSRPFQAGYDECFDGSDPQQHDKENDNYESKSGNSLMNSINLSINLSTKNSRRLALITGALLAGSWFVVLLIFLRQNKSTHSFRFIHDQNTDSLHTSGKKLLLDDILNGLWIDKNHEISWIAGPNDEDGLLLEQGSQGKDYLVVEDIRGNSRDAINLMAPRTLMKKPHFKVGDKLLTPSEVFPSKDLKKVLIATEIQKSWRYSFNANYWIFDVETQIAEPLDPSEPEKHIQLASWSPQSNAIVFTRENNLFLRKLSSSSVIQITNDGSEDLFYGIPDWVYEEEVFEGNSATWWAEDGNYIAFLCTNESMVPEFPVQYFISRPSKVQPLPGQESYPEVREIKYPKAGAPNPIVELKFYDINNEEVFQVAVTDSFAPEDLLITEVVWVGSTGKVLIRETNRSSDILRIVQVDVLNRTGKVVREKSLKNTDGGWFEISRNTKYVPADSTLNRPDHGYIDTVIHNNYNHLGYFTPLDNPNPILLTSGDWEVESAPSAVDFKNNLVYFIATKESPIQRHIYSVKLDGSELRPLTNISQEGYFEVSFSSGANYALLGYAGPNVPWQKVISTHGNSIMYDELIEDNAKLADLVDAYDLPTNVYSTVTIDGFDLQVVERRPPHFSDQKKYPVLFYLYGGPGSQTVTKKFGVDFQSYVAANLEYIVVTVDGRGTGFIGRKARTIVRDNLGYYEAHDQIETAKLWAKKTYVDPCKIAIWGWSYGGFMTLKTLEQDAGHTFSYGMAVAPVTDWRYYDSIYTERYMHTPQQNPSGYKKSSISNMTALQQNERFLIMHGVADDNVHLQNTLTLLDKFDVAGVENYDVHIFPDSDHQIFFHNANRIVYHKLSNWIINAFSGEWLKVSNPGIYKD